MIWAGVDYGSKLAGTTCVSFLENDWITVLQSRKGDDADQWLQQVIQENNIQKVFLDAPLSLPAAYFDASSDDFFYRKADRILGAMSPMFLGGLTARAMRLKRTWNSQGITVYETYPAALNKELALANYKKDIGEFLNELFQQKGLEKITLKESIKNWHQLDALLAWYSGWRHQHAMAKEIGDDNGLIIT